MPNRSNVAPTHWASGGATNLENCVLLCAPHHRLVHEEGFHVRLLRDELRFFTPDWLLVPEKPPAPEISTDPVDSLLADNHQAGVEPGPLSTSARYRHDDDVPLPLLLNAIMAVATAGTDTATSPVSQTEISAETS